MKRLWAAGLLLLCALSLCLWQGAHTRETARALNSELSSALKACGQKDGALAASHTQAALDAWEEARGLLCIYTAHTRVEELGKTLSGLTPLAQYGALDQLACECERALAQVEALRGIDEPTLENIL